MGGVIFLAVIVLVLAGTSIVSLFDMARQRRVSTRVRVARLRESLRRAEPGEEIHVRPDAWWTLPAEMIMEVALDEGFRFRRDTTTSINRWRYREMVFTAPPTGGSDE